MGDELHACVKCEKVKPRSDFYVRNVRGKPYRRKTCKACEKASVLSWRRGNLERVREYDRTQYAKNPEPRRLRLRERRVHDPDAVREIDMKQRLTRRARKSGSQAVPVGRSDLDAKLEYCGSQCAYCGESLTAVHWDHWKPLSKGGPHMLANLYPACPPCNQRKAAKWPYPAPNGLRMEVGA